MAFKREFLITWDELAPSLQLLFNNLQTQITDNRNEITNLDQRVTDLENKNDEVFVDGSQGQFVKIDIVNHSLYAHDGFVRLRCVDNDEELQEEMKNIPLTLEEVFNSWYRYAHYNKAATDRLDFTNAPDNVPQGQNLNHTEYNIYTNKQNSGWVFDRSSQTISGTYDGCVTSGFINPTNYYTNYYLTTKVNTGWDDDNLMIIVGYTRDSKGKEHTLSIVRGAGNIGGDDFNNTWLGYGPGNGYHIDCKFWWGLIYDMGNDTQFIIEDKSKETGPSSFFTKETRNAIAYITAIRSDDKFEFRTSRFSADGSDKNYVPEWNIYFQLPDSKPESWSQEMYDNIKIMLTQTNRVGFGTRSGQPSFSIEKQISIFDDEDIYALHTDTVYTWVPGEGKWVAKGKVHEILSNRIFIYYARKNYLYFYLFWNSWTKMILDPNKDILDQIKDQINNIENNITDIKGDINNINNSITNIENITNNISNITTSGEQGQVIKINSDNSLFADDNFRSTNIIIDNSELEHILQDINPSLDMKNIFNTWRIILHYDTEAAIYNDYTDRVYLNDGHNTYFSCQNTEISKYNITSGGNNETSEKWLKVLDKSSNSWYYDESNNRIVENFNYSCFSAFIQENNFTDVNYYIEFYLNCKTDYDHFCIIFGFMTDDDGIEHTLSFVKAAGYYSDGHDDTYYGYGSSVKVDSRVWSAIVYDFMNPTQQILFDNSKEVGPCDYTNMAHYETIVGFRRLNKNSFNIQSSKWSYNDISNRENPEFYEPYTLNVSFPTTKPNEWDDNMWNNIQIMLSSNIFGVGVRSMLCSFNIRNQQGVFPVYDELYCITNGIHYKWNYKTQKFDEYNDIPNRILLYDPFKKKLYFYYYKGNYIEFFN